MKRINGLWYVDEFEYMTVGGALKMFASLQYLKDLESEMDYSGTTGSEDR